MLRCVLIISCILSLAGSTQAIDDLSNASAEQRATALVAMLRGSAKEVEAAVAIVQRLTPDDAALLPSILKWVEDDRADVRRAAAKALRRIGTHSVDVRNALKRLVADSDRLTVFDAHLAEGALGFEDRAKSSTAAEEIAILEGETFLPEAIRCLLDAEESEAAFRLIERSKISLYTETDEQLRNYLRQVAPVAVATLSAQLGEANPKVQLRALRLLTILGPMAEAAVPDLCRLIESANGEVQRQACFAAGMVGAQPDACERALSSLIDGQDPETAWMAAVSLARLQRSADRAIPHLVARAADQSVDRGRRCASLDMLGHFGGSAANCVPSVIEILENEPDLAESACRCLKRIGPTAVPAVLALAQRRSGDSRLVALTAIGDWENNAAIELLVETCKAEMTWDQPSWFSLCEACADRRLELAIVSALESQKGKSRRWLTFYFQAIQPKTHEALEALMSRIDDPDPEVAINVIDALGRMGRTAEVAVPSIERAGHRDRLVLSAAAALMKIVPERSDIFQNMLERGSRHAQWAVIRQVAGLNSATPELIAVVRNRSYSSEISEATYASLVWNRLAPNDEQSRLRLVECLLNDRWSPNTRDFAIQVAELARDRKGKILRDQAARWQFDDDPMCAEACQQILLSTTPGFEELATKLDSDRWALSLMPQIQGTSDILAAARHLALLRCESVHRGRGMKLLEKLSEAQAEKPPVSF
jgi:HEAT repeat protein